MAALGLTLAVITLVSIRLSSQSTVSANIPPLLPCPLSGAFDYYYNWYEGYGFEQRHLLKWTRDGSGILFHRLMRLYSVEPDGSRLHRIVNGAPDHDFGPEDYFGLYADMSPDNSRIAYSTCFYPMGMDIAKRFGYQFHNYEIETSNIDGTERRRLTENDTFEHFPVWSPDGERLAFISDRDLSTYPRSLGIPEAGLYTMAADGSDVRSLTPSLQEDLPETNDGVAMHAPSWSPDGRRIAFVVNEGKDHPYRRAIYVVMEDGSNLTRISEALSAPSWSPSGERIAFARPHDNGVSLFTAAPDGSELREVTFISGPQSMGRPPFDWEVLLWVERVSWSPDGTRILFTCETVCIANFDGSPVRSSPIELPIDVDMGAFKSVAAWSPDGSRIAVRGPDDRAGAFLFTMAPDGTDVDILVRGGLSLVAENSGWQDVDVGIASCSEGLVIDNPGMKPGLVRDCRTLMQIRDTLAANTSGSVALNWGPGTPMEQWDGVTIGLVGHWSRGTSETIEGPFQPLTFRVTGLSYLPSLGLPLALRGTIPKELSGVEELQVVNFRGNMLIGGIPSSLALLPNLRELRLCCNELNGGIPSSLGTLENLEILSLEFNNLTGSIPTELGNLTNLTGLYLQDNELTGSIPAELGNLTNLTGVYLHYNELTGSIPAELGNLNNLDELNLYYNELTGSIPAELGNLNNLTSLDLNDNELTGSIPAELGNLNNLTSLDLNDNELTGSIPAGLGNLNNLTSLDLYGNELSGCIPQALRDVQFSDLSRLELEYCE